MYWTNIGLIIVAGLNIGLALLVWLRNPKNKINITFAITVFLVGTWTLGMALFREAQTVQTAWIWTWVQNGSGAMLVIPFFFLSIYFPYQSKILKSWQVLLIGISIVVMILVTIIPGIWVKEIILRPSNNTYLLGRLGITYFNIHFYFYVILAFYTLFQKYKISQGFIRTQLTYMMTAAAIIGIFASFFAALAPLFFLQLGPYWLGPYFSLPMIILLVRFIYKKD
ncbi:MAG: histidine kinase N-terminal 7TM domain-containing protein [Patescibacteria group bacterium]|jgi:hypothetical protein